MLPLIIALCAFFGFLITLWTTPRSIKYLRRIGLEVQDQHKEGKPLVPLSGGITVLAGVIAGLMLFMFFSTFIPVSASAFDLTNGPLALLLVAIITIFTITFIGFIDDLLIRKSKTSSAGLKQWQKPLFTLAAAVPLMVVKAGESTMAFPLIGHVNFGILYPLLLVPIGVVGAANMVNMFAGFNGMEAGMGIFYMLSLGLYAFVNGRQVASLIALITFATLLAFYFYNKLPARILPGDSLTYLLGATLATVAIVGNLERAALILSIPFIVEFILKARGKFKKTSVGYIKDGKLHSHYKKVYSIPHFFMRKGKYTEQQIVSFMFIIQLIFSGLIWVV